MQCLVRGFGECREQCPTPPHLYQDFDIPHRARLWTLPPKSVNGNVPFFFLGSSTVSFYDSLSTRHSVLLLLKQDFDYTLSLSQCSEETWCRSVLTVKEAGVFI